VSVVRDIVTVIVIAKIQELCEIKFPFIITTTAIATIATATVDTKTPHPPTALHCRRHYYRGHHRHRHRRHHYHFHSSGCGSCVLILTS
jgi:hypothetical protein